MDDPREFEGDKLDDEEEPLNESELEEDHEEYKEENARELREMDPKAFPEPMNEGDPACTRCKAGRSSEARTSMPAHSPPPPVTP